MEKSRIGKDLRRISAAGATAGAALAALAGALGAGCAAERPWAAGSHPPLRLLPGEPRPAAVLGPEDERTIRASALGLAGGASSWDGRTRLRSGEPRWSDVPAALAAAGDRAGIEVVIARTAEDGSGDAWAFDLATSDREPGRFRLERERDGGGAAPPPPADEAAPPLPEDWRLVEVRLGDRPDASAMRARAARLATAFGEELARLAEVPRFVEAGDG